MGGLVREIVSVFFACNLVPHCLNDLMNNTLQILAACLPIMPSLYHGVASCMCTFEVKK